MAQQIAARTAEIDQLLERLSLDLEDHHLSVRDRDASLENLKVYGRVPSQAGPIFTRRGIETLARHSFESQDQSTSHAALRCLANALTLSVEARQLFVDLDYEEKTCQHLAKADWDNEFLCSRLIFLTTYGTTVNVAQLVDQHDLATIVIAKLVTHSRLAQIRSEDPQAQPVQPIEQMALVETLKLMFNVTHFAPDRAAHFASTVPYLAILITHCPTNSQRPLDPPIGPLINAFANLDLEDKLHPVEVWTSEEQGAILFKNLIKILDLSTKFYAEKELEVGATPLVNVISKFYALAIGETAGFVRSQILPTEEDRQQVLGSSDSLPSRLLKTSSDPTTSELWKAVSHLMFELSGRDAAKFVGNVGYGYASGFLFQNKIPIPQSMSQTAGTAPSGSGDRPVNPVTGQFLDRESLPNVPEMTEEEKEREAEKLFVLFERLKQTGVVDVENPVITAMREGKMDEEDKTDRIEELD